MRATQNSASGSPRGKQATQVVFAELRSQQSNTTSQHSTTSSAASQYATVPPTQQYLPDASQSSTYAAIAKREPATQTPPTRKIRSALHHFAPSAYSLRNKHEMWDDDQNFGPSFTYIHLHLKYRSRITVTREKLKTLCIDNGRTLDIHYPAEGILSVLVHMKYRSDFTDIIRFQDWNTQVF